MLIEPVIDKGEEVEEIQAYIQKALTCGV